MSVFPNPILRLSTFLKKVGKCIHKVEKSKFIQFMKRNRLFALIPLAFLSWQLAVTRTELDTITEQRNFLSTRLDTYFREWEDLEFGLWEKLKVGDNYVFMSVNDAYERIYLSPNELTEIGIIGKNNLEVFGELVGGNWQKNDSAVAYTGNQAYAVELAKYGDRLGHVFVTKWRKIRRNGDTTVVGMAINMDTLQNIYLRALEVEYPNGLIPIKDK